MRTTVITKQARIGLARRQFQAQLFVNNVEAFAFAGTASVSVALSLGAYLMAGMSDNPLIGDYTKGISKGVSYFEGLERRFKAEKVPTKVLAEDLASPFALVMKRQNPLSEGYGKRGFSSRQTAQNLSSSTPKSASFLGSKKSSRHVKPWTKVMGLDALREHFDK